MTLRDIKNQTEEICKIAVQQNGRALEYVNNQTYEICKLAVKQNGSSLRYVFLEYRTDELCKIAVQSNGNALQYVENQTREICILALNWTLYTRTSPKFIIQHIKDDNLKKEICLRNMFTLLYQQYNRII